tara:strand:- start:10 stop:501 length:492 start_codon:yes stop_codon:yes gene_type:complete
MNDEDGRFKFRMPTAPAYLKKHYHQKCIWNCTRVVLPVGSTAADDKMIMIQLGVPSSQTFIIGDVGGYANFNSETPSRVTFLTTPIENERVEFINFSDEIQTSQVGASAWGNELEVSIWEINNAGAFTLLSGLDEVIQIQIECMAYNDKYDYEHNFLDHHSDR